MIDKRKIRKRALEIIAESGSGVTSRLVEEFGLSRQAASNHVRALVEEGQVEARGETKARVYRLVTRAEATRTYPVAALSEDVVWREVFLPIVTGLRKNVRDIWQYGVTEMVNNAIDHSGSPEVHVGVRLDAVRTDGWVADDGEGIFLKIQRALGLYDPREALLELAKGKLTTDPASHTGEGIFFTSRVFDVFVIRSGDLAFRHDEDPLDVLMKRPAPEQGTIVVMRLANDSPRTTKQVFDEFAAPDAYTFDKTIVPVRLAQYEGEKLVSRSQAKRVSQRFERFRHVVLDFRDVVEIGQAFADELFRVFAEAHPAVTLAPINMTPEVRKMVARARAGQATQ